VCMCGKIIFIISLKVKYFLIVNTVCFLHYTWSITFAHPLHHYSTLWLAEKVKKSMAKKIGAYIKAQSFHYDLTSFQTLLSTQSMFSLFTNYVDTLIPSIFLCYKNNLNTQPVQLTSNSYPLLNSWSMFAFLKDFS